MLKEPTRRIRFLTHDEAQRLARGVAGASGGHGGVLARDGFAGGQRHRVCSGRKSTWRDGWRGFIPIRRRRGRRSRCRSTRTRCCSSRKQVGKHATHVFSYQGKPIIQVSTKAWYAALERAGIEDFRWHDLRHTWASWHVQNGTPLFALQELGGWESRGDGATLCASRGRSFGAVCRTIVPTSRRRCAKLMAQIRHSPENDKGLHRCKPLICLVAGAGFEPATFGL